MRTVTFTLRERAVLIPLEICMLWKQLGLAVVIFFILSGVSPDLFSPTLAVTRGIVLAFATLTAMMAGAVVTPLLLPWVPFRQFWLKGMIIGGLAYLLPLFVCWQSISSFEKIAIFLWTSGCSSYLAMNFTGSTPFTSLFGVAKEMRRGLVFQISTTVVALICWVVGPFV